ncbi:MAG: DUF4907 domain-containing protein [Bacteroidales bacterium]|nr:DUF4907 domain-containing protein [Bacteroidales bacterium]
MKKIALITILFISFVSCLNKANNQNTETYIFDTVEVGGCKFHLETQAIDSGWGYIIFVDNKKLINQKCIPAVEGNHTFKNQEDALNCGKLVVNKMINGSTLPSITMEDLVKLKIINQNYKLEQ